MNFLLLEMTFLRYFMPLILEGNKRGIKSRVFMKRNEKYNNPYSFKDSLNNLAAKNKFELFDIDMFGNFDGHTFMIEGRGHERIDKTKHKGYSITYMTDFSGPGYDKYVDKIDKVIFPSEHMAGHYDKKGPKNLYLGSPKYDIKLNEEDILKKYNIPDLNNVLVLIPRTREMISMGDGHYSGVTGQKLLGWLGLTAKSLGLRTLYKTRAKDRWFDLYNCKETKTPSKWEKVCPHMYFEDDSWHPHTTMELIKVSKLVINFSSTAIKECVMLDTPIINFDIKPQIRWGRDMGKHRLKLDFLYENDFCYNAKVNMSEQEYKDAFNKMMSSDWSSSFSDARKKYLFEGDSSKRILDYLEIA